MKIKKKNLEYLLPGPYKEGVNHIRKALLEANRVTSDLIIKVVDFNKIYQCTERWAGIKSSQDLVIIDFETEGHSFVTIFPKQFLWATIKEPFLVYRHFGQGLNYFGLTKRDWYVRWMEHIKAESIFGHKIRENVSLLPTGEIKTDILVNNPSYNNVIHFITDINLSRKAAFEREAELIKQYSLFPLGQNISPGGVEGVETFYKAGIFKSNDYTKITDEEYEAAQDIFLSSISTDTGLNSVFESHLNFEPMSDKQKIQIVCSNPNNLNVADVRFIKMMTIAGHNRFEIYKEASKQFKVSYDQIENIMAGKRYRFVA